MVVGLASGKTALEEWEFRSNLKVSTCYWGRAFLGATWHEQRPGIGGVMRASLDHRESVWLKQGEQRSEKLAMRRAGVGAGRTCAGPHRSGKECGLSPEVAVSRKVRQAALGKGLKV